MNPEDPSPSELSAGSDQESIETKAQPTESTDSKAIGEQPPLPISLPAPQFTGVDEDPAPESPKRISPTQTVILLVVLGLLGYPLAHWAMNRSSTPGVPATALPPGIQGSLNQSFNLYQNHKYEEAIAVGLVVVKDHPEIADAWNNLAASYASLGRWDEAITNANQALRINPGHSLARGNLEYAQKAKANNGRPPEPNSAQGYLNLSVAQYQEGKLAECIDSAAKAIRLDPKLGAAFNNRGACFAAIGMFDEAIQSEQEALRLDPANQLAKNNLTWAQDRQKLRDAIKVRK